MRNLFGREPSPAQEQRFNEFVALLARYELHEAQRHDEMLSAWYCAWAEKFDLLKAEFNALWDFFSSLEPQLTGWYAISPNLAPWKSVACGRGGYSFAACMMKNHHRDAPLSEKSLSVSFAVAGREPGIGDERLIGLPGEPTDDLAGLAACTRYTRRQQAHGARTMLERLSQHSLIFRLNHRSIGQQTASYPLSILEQHSLKSLCQGLFVMLNNDVAAELKAALDSPEKLLLAHEAAIEAEVITVS